MRSPTGLEYYRWRENPPLRFVQFYAFALSTQAVPYAILNTMKKSLAIVLLAIILLSTLAAPAFGAELLKSGSQGEDVLRVQARLAELGYFNIRPTGVFGGKTRSCVVAFQEFNEIMADGTIGQETMDRLFAVSAVRHPIGASVEIPIGPSVNAEIKIFGVAMPWEEVNALFEQGVPTTITDSWTERTFNVTRLGGENHAEVACSTANDVGIFLEVFGGEPNWSKRPVVVHLQDQDVAASLQGMNHGEDSVEGSGLQGYCCLYFTSSTAHFHSLIDVEHRSNIQDASAGAAS